MGKGCLVPLFRFHSQKPTSKRRFSCVSLVTIPALTTIVDRQFKEDRTLCPVRALRYYLDRTKDLRGSQSLLFISFKKGHTSDITPATLSSYLNKLSYFVINKQINSLGPGPSQSMTLGPSWPLRPFTVGYRWTKSCKRVTGKLTHIFGQTPYLVRQQQYVSGTSCSDTTSPRPFPSASSSSGRKEGAGGTPTAAKSSGVYPRVQLLVTSPDVYGKVSYILTV